MNTRIKRGIATIVHGWIGSFLLAILIATSVKSAIADWYEVPTGSMLPTIVEGDRIFVNKLAYDLKVPYTTWHLSTWDDPQRGDIVVFTTPSVPHRLVKRVVGIPGDMVAMVDNHLIINGNQLDYRFLHDGSAETSMAKSMHPQQVYLEDLSGHIHKAMFTPNLPAYKSFPPMQIPEGRYLMMGDNRDNSADSRYFGFVERDAILGKAHAVVISMDLENYRKPRWERFFTKLL